MAPPVNGSPNPTGWYYERTKKKYNQEQMKMTKAEKARFALKFPKKQIIKKEELAKYLYAIEMKPDLVAKGSNWVIKDFGAAINEAYKKIRHSLMNTILKNALLQQFCIVQLIDI